MTEEEANKLPLGGPIGGAVGGVVILLVVIAVVVFITRKRYSFSLIKNLCTVKPALVNTTTKQYFVLCYLFIFIQLHFISIIPVLNDHMSYVTIFDCSLGRSQKTGLTVCRKDKE